MTIKLTDASEYGRDGYPEVYVDEFPVDFIHVVGGYGNGGKRCEGKFLGLTAMEWARNVYWTVRTRQEEFNENDRKDSFTPESLFLDNRKIQLIKEFRNMLSEHQITVSLVMAKRWMEYVLGRVEFHRESQQSFVQTYLAP